MKSQILIHLHDLEHMVEALKVKANEHWQWDIIQKIYSIISLVNEIWDDYELKKENLKLIEDNMDLRDKLKTAYDTLVLAKQITNLL